MAGETIKTSAICLRITPWSRTSHIVQWLTPHGKIVTVVKGAMRPKSAFLGQYDLNYTCEILYYARAKGELRALRECVPLELRSELRQNFKALVIADYVRTNIGELAPMGAEAAEWYELLARTLERLRTAQADYLKILLQFECAALHLAGLSPELEANSGGFVLRGERRLPISPEVARCIQDLDNEKNSKILLDAARVIGVFYTFHLDCAVETRRAVLKLISSTQ